MRDTSEEGDVVTEVKRQPLASGNDIAIRSRRFPIPFRLARWFRSPLLLDGVEKKVKWAFLVRGAVYSKRAEQNC